MGVGSADDGMGTAAAAAPPGPSGADMDVGYMASDDVTCLLLDLMGGDRRQFGSEKRSAAKKMVSEVFSPPRVAATPSRYPNKYLLPGFALDLACTDPADGQPWDFDRPVKRQRAMALFRCERPLFVICSLHGYHGKLSTARIVIWRSQSATRCGLWCT